VLPINTRSHTFGTVAFWRSAAPHYGCRNWREAMRRFAIQHGKAICMMADDSARIVERDSSLKAGVRVHRLPAENVHWHQN